MRLCGEEPISIKRHSIGDRTLGENFENLHFFFEIGVYIKSIVSQI